MNNPYSAPTADFSSLEEAGSDTYKPRFFSLSGRIGRLRYLAYSWGAYMLLSIALEVLTEVTSGSNPTLNFLIYIPVLGVAVVMSKRRLYDLDKPGWMATLVLVPVLNAILGLYLTFAPGNEGANKHGQPPAKNSVLVILGACLLPLVMVTGILAAIAIPAYQGYVQKAKQAQMGHSQ